MDAAAIWLAYNEAENRSDFGQMASLVSGDLAVEVNGKPALGSAADDERIMRQICASYPDYHREIDEIIGAGNRAIARWRMLGTATSAGTPDLDVHGCSVIETDGPVMIRAYLYYDAAALDALIANSSIVSR